MTAIFSQDDRFMAMALQWARRGGAKVSPNPQVGCVLVKNGRVIGAGHHAYFGGPHAEVAALKNTGETARGATAFVNLEPCCHTDKKTPPCVPALVAAGVRRVVIGMKDPNPKVAGRAIRQLNRAGIKTTLGVMEAECRELNRPFIVRMKKQRPYVIVKGAASLDGKMATASGESRWITSPQARKAAHRMRAEADAVLVGIGTVLADNPSLTSHSQGRNPTRVVLDSRLRTPVRAKVLDGSAPTLIFSAKKTLPPKFRRSLASVVRTPGSVQGVDLRFVLRHLLGCGIGTLLVEGGSRIHASFLEAGFADELRLFLAPRVIGGDKAPGFFDGHGIARLKDALRISDLKVRHVGPDLLITGLLGDY